jgi:hypothetical protein
MAASPWPVLHPPVVGWSESFSDPVVFLGADKVSEDEFLGEL